MNSTLRVQQGTGVTLLSTVMCKKQKTVQELRIKVHSSHRCYKEGWELLGSAQSYNIRKMI